MHTQGRSGRSIGLALAMIVCLGLGGAVGAWFATHYRIVPVSGSDPLAAVEAPAISLPAEAPSSDGALGAAPAVDRTAPTATGPFRFRFTPGESLDYVLRANVSGQGYEDIGPSPVQLGIDGDLRLETLAVDPAGVGDLSLTYQRMDVSGDFMDSPFDLNYDPSGTRIGLHGSVPVDTRRGVGSTQGIEQVQFLEDPVRMRVDPNGRVLNVSGAAGWGDMLRETPGFSPVEFPDAELRSGLEWESRIAMPVPGIGEPIPTRVHNKVIGYQYLGSRYCAVIEQTLDSRQQDGRLHASDSSLGKEADFRMSMFDLSGKNMVYFDVNQGQLAHSAGSYRLVIKLGSVLGEAGQMLGQALSQISQALTGDPGGSQDLFGSAAPNAGALDLALDIDTSLTLKDVAGGALPAEAPAQ